MLTYFTKRIFIIGILFFSIESLWSSGGQVSSAAYLKLGMDARGIAVGRAYTALANGASAIYWNPAGILNPEVNGRPFDVQITNLLNSPWDVNYLTSAVAWRWKRFAIGLGYINYGVDQIPEYDELMNYYGDFRNVEQAGLFGLAFNFPGLFQVGITGFYLNQEFQNIHLTSGNLIEGWGINFGLIMRPFLQYKQFEIGILLNDNKMLIVNKDNKDRDSTSIIINVGFKWDIYQSTSQYLSSITLLADFEQEKDFPVKVKFGSEVLVAKFGSTELYVRSGIDDVILEMRPLADSLKTSYLALDDQITRLNRKFTFGVGLQYQLVAGTILIADYAWVKETFRSLHFLTLKIVF